MKTLYTLISLIIFCPVIAQNYELGLIHQGNYDFKIVAIPDFDSAGDTDISDIGFTLMLPSGADDVINQLTLLPGRIWNVTEFNAAFLTGQGLGDGTLDAFQFNMPAGQSLIAHITGQQIDLVSFNVSNMPTTGEMSFLLNNDPIAMGAGGVLDSFYNSNIDNSTTQDYFSGLTLGMESFMFDTLSIDEVQNIENKIKIFPNPTSDYISILTNTELEKVELYTLTGKRVLYSISSNRIDVHQLPSGIYFLRLQTNQKITLTKKIIIR